MINILIILLIGFTLLNKNINQIITSNRCIENNTNLCLDYSTGQLYNLNQKKLNINDSCYNIKKFDNYSCITYNFIQLGTSNITPFVKQDCLNIFSYFNTTNGRQCFAVFDPVRPSYFTLRPYTLTNIFGNKIQIIGSNANTTKTFEFIYPEMNILNRMFSSYKYFKKEFSIDYFIIFLIYSNNTNLSKFTFNNIGLINSPIMRNELCNISSFKTNMYSFKYYDFTKSKLIPFNVRYPYFNLQITQINNNNNSNI